MILPKTIAEKNGPNTKNTNGFHEYTSEKPISFEYK